MKKNFYQEEADKFRNKFNEIKRKRIILYGIGRYTTALLNQIKDFNIVGLLDKDEENIGKTICGKRILSSAEAREQGDLIIINTSESYWNIIFNRIKSWNIPVYYRNGVLAEDKKEDDINLECWMCDKQYFEKLIKQYDVISFDLFDTLVTRKIFQPEDIFEVVSFKLKCRHGNDFGYKENRVKIIGFFNDLNYSIDDIYYHLQSECKIDSDILEEIKTLEIETEYEYLFPRTTVIDLAKEALAIGKEVCITSDMYLPSEVLFKWMKELGLNLESQYYLISGEVKYNKKDGSIWKYIRNKYDNKKILHIGDNYFSDVILPKKYGIDTVQIYSCRELLMNSSLKDITSDVISIQDSIILGGIICELFANPFGFNSSKGKIQINSFEQFGFCIYGPIIYTFIRWLCKEIKEKNVDELIFLARDAYFIQEDYKFYCKLNNVEEKESKYLAMSRRLIMMASIEDEKGFYDLVRYPYCGSFAEYMIDRFNITVDRRTSDINEKQINSLEDYEKILVGLKCYEQELYKEIKQEHDNFLGYLKMLNISNNAAIVDTGYHGNPQMYLTKILKRIKTVGLYFYADLSDENECLITNDMFGCFQEKEDKKASNCELKKRIQITESIFTAPYGMIRMVDSEGKMVCADRKMNQKYFAERKLINEGIKRFIAEQESILDLSVEKDAIFADKLFGVFMKNDFIFGNKIREILYADDSMVQRREIKIFGE